MGDGLGGLGTTPPATLALWGGPKAWRGGSCLGPPLPEGGWSLLVLLLGSPAPACGTLAASGLTAGTGRG